MAEKGSCFVFNRVARVGFALFIAWSFLGYISPQPSFADSQLADHNTIATYTYGKTQVTTEQGIDACGTSLSALTGSWWSQSPYYFTNVYMGGPNLSSGCTHISASWISSLKSTGWALVPTWVDYQAPCSSSVGATFSTNTSDAWNKGGSAGSNAAATAKNLGIGPGSIIYDDIEYYPGDRGGSCDLAVAYFVNNWVRTIQSLGYSAGVYISASNLGQLCSYAGAGQIAAPNDVWIASWNGDGSIAGVNAIPPACWTPTQRIHQWSGGVNETWGGITMNIDKDRADGEVSI
jgi:Domain of unknown function (DUF1906)